MHHDLFLDGDWLPGARGTFVTVDPATGARLADVAAAGAADVAAAVAVARTAVADGRWAYVPSTRRGQVLYHLAQLVHDHAAEIARWETLDTGEPITVTRLFELPSAVEAIRQAATATLRFSGGRSRAPRAVAIVVDDRFPFTALVRELLDALVAGDAVVVAPSCHAPLTALLLAELCAEAGLPDGVLGVVTGTPDVTAHLLAHPGVDRVVMASFANRTKAAAVVTEAADIDEMLAINPLGGLSGVGRYATGFHHVDVHTSRADEFLAKLTAAVRELRVGPGRETDTECGPLASRAALAAAERYVDAALAHGASAVVGGGRPDGPLSRGWFYRPTVLLGGEWDPDPAGAAPDAPVVRVGTWRDRAELRDHRPDDLWSGRVTVWSEDLPDANRLATALQAGQVYVNAGPVVETDTDWHARGETPRPLTREPGLLPRGPGSRRTSTVALPPVAPLFRPPAARTPPPAARPAAEEPEPTADVPAPWGGQVRRFVGRRLRIAQLQPIGAARGPGGGSGDVGPDPHPRPRRAG